MSVLNSFCWYRRGVSLFFPISMIAVAGIAAVPNFVQSAQTSLENSFTASSLVESHKQTYSNSFKTTGIKKENPFLRSGFEGLANQLLFWRYCQGMYKKIKHYVFKSEKLSFNKVLFKLGETITRFTSALIVKSEDKAIIQVLLNQLIKLSFYVPADNSTFFIENPLQFKALLSFMDSLVIFKQGIPKALKKTKLFKPIAVTLRQLNTLLVSIDVKLFEALELPSEAAINQLIRLAKYQSPIDGTLNLLGLTH